MASLENYFPENSFWNHNDTPPGIKIKLFTKPEELIEDLKKFKNQTAGLYRDHVYSVLENNTFKPKNKYKDRQDLMTEGEIRDVLEKDRNISAWRFLPIFEEFLKHHKISE